MQVHQLKLTKKKLAAMPSAERTVLLLLGHASNEINILSKLILMARKNAPAVKLIDHVEAGQIFIVMRLLIGKLHEAWELFRVRLQADELIRSKYLSKLGPEADAALKSLNKHFGQKSPLTDIRNKLSFHYKDDANLIEANFQRLPETEPWEFYLCRTNGNTFYYASELVVSGGVISLVRAKNSSEASSNLTEDAQKFAQLCGIVVSVSRQITSLFGELIASIVSTSIGDDLEVTVTEIPDGPKLSTFWLPYFFDENDTFP